jgi:hypothetical protein
VDTVVATRYEALVDPSGGSVMTNSAHSGEQRRFISFPQSSPMWGGCVGRHTRGRRDFPIRSSIRLCNSADWCVPSLEILGVQCQWFCMLCCVEGGVGYAAKE